MCHCMCACGTSATIVYEELRGKYFSFLFFFHLFVGVLHFQCIVYILHIHSAGLHLKLCGVLLHVCI